MNPSKGERRLIVVDEDELAGAGWLRTRWDSGITEEERADLLAAATQFNERLGPGHPAIEKLAAFPDPKAVSDD